jgi:hypothetical protein
MNSVSIPALKVKMIRTPPQVTLQCDDFYIMHPYRALAMLL